MIVFIFAKDLRLKRKISTQPHSGRLEKLNSKLLLDMSWDQAALSRIYSSFLLALSDEWVRPVFALVNGRKGRAGPTEEKKGSLIVDVSKG